MTTYGPEAISLDDVLTIAETAMTAVATDLEPEDIAFLADAVISALIARDLLNAHN